MHASWDAPQHIGMENGEIALNLANKRAFRVRRALPVHDPQKWEPVLREDHAPTKS
jgi:hypothetical protein